MKPMVRIHDTKNDIVTDREMNDEEYAQYEIDVENVKTRIATKEQAATDKAALLERLGISADEAKLLLS